MKKSIKICLFIFLSMVFSFNPIIANSKIISDVNLVEDSSRIDTLPKNFRKSSDKIYSNENLNLYGLDNLNISGSGQFSKNGLSLIKDSIGNKMPITIVDLRQESHGFINGIPISFENALNNANIGLNTEEVLKDEVLRLNSIKLNSPITFYNTKKTIIPKEIETENTLTKNNKLSYIRIPVTDSNLPTDAIVDYFVDFVKKQPKNSWLHFHCKEGIGRTTTFMIMYDIMKNCHNVSLNDIINRQILLSKLTENNTKDFYTGKRFEFLNKFYNKCKENNYFVYLIFN